jgi:Tfp pilus assembly protein PilF
MRSYKAQTSLLAMVLLVAAMPAIGQSQDDQYNQAVKNLANGSIPPAWTAFCGPLKGFKDSDAKCVEAKGLMTPYENRHNSLYLAGMDFMQKGDYEKAESNFKQVKYGKYIDEARTQLAEATKLKNQKAASEAAAQQSASAASASEAKFNDGVGKFAAGDVAAAKAAFEAVTGNHQPEANAYLSRINNYIGKMAEGKSFESQGNFRGAANAYNSASLSVPTASEAQTALQRATNAASTGSAPTPNTQQQQPETKAASKDVVKQIDVNAYMAQGKKMLAKGDFARARRYFGDVLAQDKNNKEAQDGLAEIAQKDTTKAAATDEDSVLAAALRTYYEGDFKAAEFRLDNYIYNNLGKKQGLANFYRGVLYLQTYYLGGERDSQSYQEAVKRFRTAKATDGFVPPEKYVSPRIIKVYKEAAGS